VIKGIIDRLDHDGEGNWEIHDYKSGKRALTQNQADRDNQLALYQIGLMSKYKEIKSVKLVWHFLQHGIEVESDRTEKQLDDLSKSLKKQIDKIQSQIKNGAEFPVKKSILCNWCYYWKECPAQYGANPFIK
jgi:RecB family exonuclease